MSELPPSDQPASPHRALVLVLLSVLSVTVATESLLESSASSITVLSPSTWRATVEWLGSFENDGVETRANVTFGALLGFWSVLAVAALTLGGWLLSRRTGKSFAEAATRWASAWKWWLLPAGWEVARVLATLVGWESALGVLSGIPNLVFAIAFAGWLAEFVELTAGEPGVDAEPSPWSVPRGVWIGVAVYVVVFGTMNWRLHANVLIPHGDSGMYEEHLWNVVHGKGFRSYLDRGLFLGEHVQVIHLLLLPVHLVWPSLVAMDLCESLALASGAIAVFWIARRHGRSSTVATLLAYAYLCYVPLQMLDIAIDLKTFRPIAFGVPAMLFAIDAMERRRFRTMLALFVLALSAKEDYAIVIAPLGVWLAASTWWSGPRSPASRTTMNDRSTNGAESVAVNDSATEKPGYFPVVLGLGIAVVATAYLLLVVAVVLPWFRDGVEVHYVGYFSRFGDSLGEVIRNLLGNPALLVSALATTSTATYTLIVLLPLGLLPLLAPWRLIVGLPLFVLLCLNEVAVDPRHHFHAPLVPILFWSLAAGVGRFDDARRRRFLAVFACGCAVLSGTTLGLHPLSGPFWDTGSAVHWSRLYGPSPRSAALREVTDAIPQTARVYATDLAHTRMTHWERSYDLSDFPRPSDAELAEPIPGEEYYLVLDVSHATGAVHDLTHPKLADHANEWERLEESNAWFHVYRGRLRP